MANNYKTPLNEAYGMAPQTNEISAAIVQYAKRQMLVQAQGDAYSIANTTRGYMMSIYYNCGYEDEIEFNFKPWFGQLVLNLSLGIDPNSSSGSSNGGYDNVKSGNSPKGFKVIINLSLFGQYQEVLNKLSDCIAHEITHAYEDYSRHQNYNAQSMTVSNMRKAYNRRYEFDKPGTFDGEMNYLIYSTFKTEISAFIAQSVSELENLVPLCQNTQEIQAAIKRTTAYNNMLRIRNFYKVLSNMQDPLYQQKALQVYNYFRSYSDEEIEFSKKFWKPEKQLQNRAITNYATMLKILQNRINLLSKKIQQQLSNAAYSIYARQNQIDMIVAEALHKYLRKQFDTF